MRGRDLIGSIEAYRGRRPIDDEAMRLVLVGTPEGAPRRRMQRVVVLVVLFGAAAGLLAARTGAPGGVTVVGTAIGVLLGFSLVPRRDRPTAVCLTTARTLVARADRPEDDPVVELPADAVTYVELTPDVEPFWVAGKVVEARLHGPAGITATLAMQGVEIDALRQVLEEAGVAHLDSPTPAPAGEVRFWLPKAFVVGLLLFVGGGFLLLAPVVFGDAGARDAVACAAVGAVLLLAGEGLRRVLFRRT